MKVYNNKHVYECIPPYLDNMTLPEDKQIVIGLMCVTYHESKAYQRDMMEIRADFEPAQAYNKIEERTKVLLKTKFGFIRNLEIEGHEGEIDFDTFIKDAPTELVKWFSMAVMSTEILTLAERKSD